LATAEEATAVMEQIESQYSQEEFRATAKINRLESEHE